MIRIGKPDNWLRRLANIEAPPRHMVVVAGGLILTAASDMATSAISTTAPQPQVVVAICAVLLCLGILLTAALPVRCPGWMRKALWRVRAVPLSAFAVSILVSVGICFWLLVPIASVANNNVYSTDVISLTRYNVSLVQRGRNPYVSDAFYADALRAYPAANPTPLRRGAFGDGMVYPTDKRIAAVTHQYVTDPSSVGGAYDPRTLHSYPALSFLLYVPAVYAGVGNIEIINILIWAGLLIWLARLAPAVLRRWTFLTVFSLAPVLIYSVILDTEVIILAFLLPAWHFRSRPYLSATLLGLACAYKQYAWFFVPVFAIMYVQDFGWLDTLKRGFILLASFLLPNLPFILMSPGPWLTSLFLPMSDPLFPLGIGAVALSVGHLVPYAPTWIYAALEGASLVGVMYCVARFRHTLGDAVLLLAIVPLFFAFRSSTDYFTIAPLLAMYAINQRAKATAHELPARGKRDSGTGDAAGRVLAGFRRGSRAGTAAS
jgi:hypothetical protein